MVVFVLFFSIHCAPAQQATSSTQDSSISVESGPYYSTMTGTVMSGYQGWFSCPGDGAELGWVHWGRRDFRPGEATVDMWPDMSEYGPDERYETGFQYADGTTATVFSSFNEATVRRHFSWMAEYGLDGVFLQRFGVRLRPGSKALRHCDQVMLNCRKGANEHKRAWALMYDLSGLPKGGTQRIIDDWRYLVDTFRVARDPADRAYLHHSGKPVVAVWGIGFSDNRKYTLQECGKLLDFLKNDPKYGGQTVMIGIPSYWRTAGPDSVKDPYRLEVFAKADILSPWSVGRYGSENPEKLNQYVQNVWVGDMKWCREQGKDYLPVVFPGFSWHNLKHGQSPLNQIPRKGGQFLWQQYYQAIKQARVTMVYQAMFDEVDESTAIFKVTNNPPVGPTPFVTYEGLPSDHYLWLVGQAARMLHREIPLTEALPQRPGVQAEQSSRTPRPVWSEGF